eukprot:851777-Amphidinium_carterae.1
MKADLKQADVDSGSITVDDVHGRLCDEGVHFWRLVGPQRRERREKQRRARLPAEPPVTPPVAPARVPDTDAPFQLGEHQRVVKHADFIQCLDCNRQAGKVKATGKYDFAHMRTQDCRQLQIKRVKKRPTAFAATTDAASSSGVNPACTSGLFPWASAVLPGNRNTGEVEPGETGSTSNVEAQWSPEEPVPQEKSRLVEPVNLRNANFSQLSGNQLENLTKAI